MGVRGGPPRPRRAPSRERARAARSTLPFGEVGRRGRPTTRSGTGRRAAAFSAVAGDPPPTPRRPRRPRAGSRARSRLLGHPVHASSADSTSPGSIRVTRTFNCVVDAADEEELAVGGPPATRSRCGTCDHPGCQRDPAEPGRRWRSAVGGSRGQAWGRLCRARPLSRPGRAAVVVRTSRADTGDRPADRRRAFTGQRARSRSPRPWPRSARRR